MQLLALGLNHTTASIALREKAAFAPTEISAALKDLIAVDKVQEAAILSTCNRTEIYCRQTQPEAAWVLRWLSEVSGFDSASLAASMYTYPNEIAVRHAFRVASGLDSMVVGEPQILGQMKQAFVTATEVGATGKILNRLFQHAFSVAKQVRTDTAIGANPVSVAYAGVSLAKRVFDALDEQTVLLIGAGETIELVVRHLWQNGVRRMLIANRSIQKARHLAQQVGCQAIALAEIPERIHAADIVVSSTASTLPILGKGTVETALKKRRHKPMLILDLAVPRDIEAAVAELRDVYLYTVDDLQQVVQENRLRRQTAAQEAENIIDLQVVRFMRWMRSLESVPAIKGFRRNLEQLKQAEIEKALGRVEAGEAVQKVVNQLAHNLVNKFAHAPSEAIRQANIDGDTELLSAAHRLFKL